MVTAVYVKSQGAVQFVNIEQNNLKKYIKIKFILSFYLMPSGHFDEKLSILKVTCHITFGTLKVTKGLFELIY